MIVFAIDPGNVESGYVLMRDDCKLYLHGKLPNDELLNKLQRSAYDVLVIEMIGHYGKGMPAGKTVFDTCVWIGRFHQAAAWRDIPTNIIMRGEEKINLCGSAKAKDANIRQALIDRFARTPNGKGTKKEPDFFYGFAADAWQAFAVGVTWLDKQKEERAYGEDHETRP